MLKCPVLQNGKRTKKNNNNHITLQPYSIKYKHRTKTKQLQICYWNCRQGNKSQQIESAHWEEKVKASQTNEEKSQVVVYRCFDSEHETNPINKIAFLIVEWSFVCCASVSGMRCVFFLNILLSLTSSPSNWPISISISIIKQHRMHSNATLMPLHVCHCFNLDRFIPSTRTTLAKLLFDVQQ